MIHHLFKLISLVALLILASCSTNHTIVNNLDEREANEIVVFLASKNIVAQKVVAAATGVGAQGPSNMFNISVAADRATDAMAILNRYGLPRRKGTSLLELFAKSGLMSTDREETIRYQAGLAEELKNTIRKIDGVLDADVQISFPPTETAPGAAPQRPTAAVYIKHQGVLEDPNSHVEMKIKRLVSSSVQNLDMNSVSVISDRSKFADIVLEPNGEPVGMRNQQQAYVSIWNIVMTKGSLSKFRWIFFTMIILLLLFGTALGYMIYQFYPQMKLPFRKPKSSETQEPELKI
ncbi:MAG: type III secretion inner membrane ring lipoprotein SctJ [Verrucomicrobia bacterium]|nr:type III secretion inner membrane ring lipoprotein SctJ [Verrucomicrobiota bacterium]